MQVSATLIAAQQAAREARARLQVPQQVPQTAQTSFAAALDKTSGVEESFSALPLKQTAAPAQTPMAQPTANAPARMGQFVNIVV
jgi:hypothetical protein